MTETDVLDFSDDDDNDDDGEPDGMVMDNTPAGRGGHPGTSPSAVVYPTVGYFFFEGNGAGGRGYGGMTGDLSDDDEEQPRRRRGGQGDDDDDGGRGDQRGGARRQRPKPRAAQDDDDDNF